MKRFIEGAEGHQVTLLPECLDDYVGEDNPVRIVDAFINELNLVVLGFDGADPAITGRPGYHPAVLLKLYIYGYLNRIQSSRRLERQAQRNVELMWLTGRLQEKIGKLRERMRQLDETKEQLKSEPGQQRFLTDPDSRSMLQSGESTGLVGYSVQTAVEGKHHLIVTHEVTNIGKDRAQLTRMAVAAREAMGKTRLQAFADRGYFNSLDIKACEDAGIIAFVPKPMTANAKANGRFGKADFIYIAKDDEYQCPAGERVIYRLSRWEDNLDLRLYWPSACPGCALKDQCTTSSARRIRRWEHEAVIDRMQQRLDRKPDAMTLRRATIEHVFGTLRHWMGSTHFLMKTMAHVGTEMSLHVLAYNLKRVMSIMGIAGTLKAMRLAGA